MRDVRQTEDDDYSKTTPRNPRSRSVLRVPTSLIWTQCLMQLTLERRTNQHLSHLRHQRHSDIPFPDLFYNLAAGRACSSYNPYRSPSSVVHCPDCLARQLEIQPIVFKACNLKFRKSVSASHVNPMPPPR